MHIFLQMTIHILMGFLEKGKQPRKRVLVLDVSIFFLVED